jgi:hypothetical protein
MQRPPGQPPTTAPRILGFLRDDNRMGALILSGAGVLLLTLAVMNEGHRTAQTIFGLAALIGSVTTWRNGLPGWAIAFSSWRTGIDYRRPNRPRKRSR